MGSMISPWVGGHEVDASWRGSGHKPNDVQQALIVGIQISDVFWVFGHLHHQGFHRCPQGRHTTGYIMRNLQFDPTEERIILDDHWNTFSCWLPWKNLVWSLDYGLKNSGELIFCCLLFNTYQSSSTTTSPLEVIFFVPNRISWRGLTRVIPLAEMARVRICNYKRHTLYCICIPRKVDKKRTFSR